MKNNIAKKISYISLILILSGCSVYKSSFDCPAKKGVGCESVSKVNELVDDDRVDEFIEEQQVRKGSKKCGCSSGNASEKNVNQGKQENYVQRNQNTINGNDLSQEKITIHFNEYKEKGVVHKASEVEVEAR